MADARKAERDARLDELLERATSWSDECQKDITRRVELLNQLLAGRGVGTASNAVQAAIGEVVSEEIDKFLVGSLPLGLVSFWVCPSSK